MAVQEENGQDHGRQVELSVPDAADFKIAADELAAMTHPGDLQKLESLGGVAGVAALLQVDPKQGIENLDAEVARRQVHFGANIYPEKPPRTFLYFVWEAMQDMLVQILFICGFATLIVSIPSEGIATGWHDAVGIFIALFLIIFVAAISNFRQQQQFRALNKEKQKIHMEVTRNGKRCKVLVDDLVVGDIIHLATGDHVPTDGLVVEGHSLTVNESSITGESELVHKGPKHPFMLAGCTIMDGFGEMMVTAVGTRTEWGKVLSAITEDSDDPTPLQVRLTKVAELLGAMGIVIGVAIFLILSIRYLVYLSMYSSFDNFQIGILLEYFTLAITVLVIAIPEGLPLAVTLTLAFSVGKMMADKSLVRHLQSCETMGCATTICSDKTGTLTLNQMAVVQSWVAGDFRKPHAVQTEVSKPVAELLYEAIATNTGGNVDQPTGMPQVVSGSPTEKALLQWGISFGMMFSEVRSQAEVLDVDPFNSTKKTMGVLVQRHVNGARRVHWKGAAEIVLRRCAFVRKSGSGLADEGGEISVLGPDLMATLVKMLKEMGSDALRTIALAYRDIPAGAQLEAKEDDEESVKLPEEGLVLLALVGIKDPCRTEVPDSVRQCQGAGICVRMVTGDSKETAQAIATECGILTPGGVVMEGVEFRQIDAADMANTLERLQVLARASPTDKLELVQQLKAMGQVVAVTGDGTNDAPALHEADIGLAMGVCGTEVAKESADIIIMDDNFASIVKTVAWGRSVYSNIQRFLQFQITVNCVALTLNFVAALVSGDAPMTVVQMLWVDLIQDTLGALSLATEPPSNRALLNPPVGRDDTLVTPVMWRNILSQSAYQLAILLLLWFDGKSLLHLPGPPGRPVVVDRTGEGIPPGDATLVTIIFCSFVFMQIFNQVNSRKLEEWNVFGGILKNKLFILIVSIELVIQVLIAQLLGEFSGCVPLTWEQWLLCIGLGAGCVPFGMLAKLLIPVPGQKQTRRSMGWTNFMEGDGRQFERLEQEAP